MQSLPDLNLAGVDLTITRIARSFNRESRMMRAEVDADNDQFAKSAGNPLTPGDFIRVAVVLDTVDGEVVVPESAVGKDSRGSFVTLVDSGNRCLRIPVNILQRNAGRVAIESPDLLAGASLLANAGEVDEDVQLNANQIVRQE